MIQARLFLFLLAITTSVSAGAAIPENIIKVDIPRAKVLRSKTVHIQIYAMMSDTVEVSVKNFDKKIKYKNSYYIPQDSMIDVILPLKDLKMGIYFLDVKKDNNILVDAYTIMVSFLRHKILKGQ